MPGIAATGVAFLVIQLLVAGFVYREAAASNRRSPLILAGCALAVSLGLVVATDSLLLVLLGQALAIVVYLAAQPRARSTVPR